MAEAVLSEAVRLHGASGPLLGNLAAAQAKLGNEQLAAKTLQQALEIDPNFAFALNWLAAREKARGGEVAALAALRKVAARPGSWRAHLWLAQQALVKKDAAGALALYREVLDKTKELPAEALAQISGDLGKAGLASDAVALVGPRYVAAVHGLPTGNNLIQACIAQKDGAGARRILAELYALPRPDWRETLLKLELAIDQVDRGYGAVTDPKTLEVTILVVERPLWMRDGPAFTRLLPEKPADAVHVAFMSGSVLNPDTVAAKTPVAKPSDGLGRFARAVPIHLAEQVHLTTDARTSLLVPWLRRGGFVLSGRPWSPEILTPMNPRPDYLVLLHFDATQTPMQVECSLVRAIDEKPVANFKQPIRLDDDFTTVRALTTSVLRELATHADVAARTPPAWLVPSSSTRLPAYCHGLEQALAVQCASQVPLNRPFLSGERNILDQLLDLTLREPTFVLARLLFLATLERESKLKAAIAAEYKEKAERLAREWKLNAEGEELAKEVMGRVVWE
jgi:tetratricopeptide (TPR) repeat protein